MAAAVDMETVAAVDLGTVVAAVDMETVAAAVIEALVGSNLARWVIVVGLWRSVMVMDTSEPRNYELRALCMECGRFRSKMVSAKPEAREVEEMAFLLEITSFHDHKDTDKWEVVWEEVN